MRLHTNFISGRSRQRQREEVLSKGCLRLALLAGLMTCAAPLVVLQFASEQAQTLKDLNDQRSRNLQNLVNSEWLEQENQRLEKGHKIVVAAHTNLAKWAAALNEIRDRAPDGLWLNQVAGGRPESGTSAAAPQAAAAAPQTGGPAPQVFTIMGTATNADAIGQYLEGLNRSALFGRATLVQSHPSADQAEDPATKVQVPAVDFEIRTVLRQSVPEGDQ